MRKEVYFTKVVKVGKQCLSRLFGISQRHETNSTDDHDNYLIKKIPFCDTAVLNISRKIT